MELARGTVSDVLERLCSEESSRLLTELSSNIPATELVSLLSDFQHGKSHMMQQLSVKMRHWTLLPWKLAGMADWEVSLARAAADTCLKLFDEIGDRPEMHHRISWYWLRPGSPVRKQVEQFRDGAPLESLPLLCRLCDEMIFVPCAERVQVT